ncbi:Peptidase M20 domain-containing protein 2 [Fusarium odoratissimum]|uniref:Peptidase M20 domain-containing protein 2 n=1 Tax=Fusarium oxysporum f. sp. cubense (strain race 4) TaxID=2502994 RepID=N1RUQ1_FUSC4|nr:Peptidase M20 domain-containing protein 2 [Fusarium odoratissimum]
MSSNEPLYEKISKSVAHHEQDLADICKKVHHSQFESGQNGKLIVFNAEYDALPGLGHACGHNLIATSSIAAFIATAETIRSLNIPGRVRLLGTPAEEGGGGKVHLIKAGAYEGVDACLMAHPTGRLSPQGEKNIDGVSAARSSARRQMKVAFTGQNAHAGNTPWHGKNALDAVVSSYVNISLLRQQIQPTERIHGVIRNGGAEPNIIPDSTNLEYYLRAAGADQIKELTGRVEACFKAGAIATGCEVKCSCESFDRTCPCRTSLQNTCKPLDEITSETRTSHQWAHQQTWASPPPPQPSARLTFSGNVTYCVPGIHPMFAVGTQDPMIQPHTPKFAEAAGTREAFERALDCAKGLAATACEMLLESELMDQARDEFKRDVEPIGYRL